MPEKQLPPGWGNQSKSAKPNWAANKSVADVRTERQTESVPFVKEESVEELSEPQEKAVEIIPDKTESINEDNVSDTPIAKENQKNPENDTAFSSSKHEQTEEINDLPTEKKKSPLTVVLVIALIIVIIALAVFAFMYFSGKSSDKNNKTSEITENSISETSVAAETTAATTSPTKTTTSAVSTTKKKETTTTASTKEIVAPTDTENVLSTKYYTLTFPTSWKGKYFYDIYEDTDYEYYSLYVYHTKTYEQNNGGMFFCVNLIPVSDDVPSYPSALYLGDLSTDSAGDFYVYAIFPTDAQFTTSTAKEYQSMYDDVYDILDTLSSCGDADFSVATTIEPFEPYIIKICNYVSIYDAPDYNSDIVDEITVLTKYTIVEESIDEYGYVWGKLESGKGWININDATYDIKIEEPNVWCPECGEGFSTTGIGTDGLTCPNCGYNWFPEDIDHTDYNEYIWNRHSIKDDFGGEEFLDDYTKEEIQTFINEILARNGYKFKEKKWLDYFSEYDWYYPDTSDFKTVEGRFCDYEKENYYYLAKYRDNM